MILRQRRVRRRGRHQGVRGGRVLPVRPLGRRRGVHPVVHQPLSRPGHPGRDGPRPAAGCGDRGRAGGDAGRGLRQVHAVDRHGRTAAWTGQNCVEWCGSVAAPGISVAGNMLAGEPTIAATLAAWQANPALELPERLMVGDGGGRGGRRRSARQAVGRHGADHHRGFPGPQPAGGRQPRAAAGTAPAAWHLAGERAPGLAAQPSRANPAGFIDLDAIEAGWVARGLDLRLRR